MRPLYDGEDSTMNRSSQGAREARKDRNVRCQDRPSTYAGQRIGGKEARGQEPRARAAAESGKLDMTERHFHLSERTFIPAKFAFSCQKAAFFGP